MTQKALLSCPRCHAPLTGVASHLSRPGMPGMRIDEPFDSGRCDPCSRAFLRLQSTGVLRSETHAPLCRVCRKELSNAPVDSTLERQVFMCRQHPRQRWTFDPAADRWTESSGYRP